MEEFKFPEGFYWGSATASEQTEPNGFNDTRGGRKNTIWDQWFKEEPNRFYEFNFSQNNFFEKFKEDITTAKNLGFNSLRVSIAWTRFINEDGTVNEEGANFYREVFTEMREQGIAPFVCLYHWGLPMYIYNEGGWLSKGIIDKFESYAKHAFERFDDLVEYWFTYNEPNVVTNGYVGGYMYPNEIDMKKSLTIQWNMLVAHKKAIKALKEGGYETKIGLIHSMSPAIPRSNNPKDLEAANFSDLYEIHSWFGPAIKGEYPKVLIDEFTRRGVWPVESVLDEEIELMKEYPIDLVGLNYYAPKRVKALSYTPDWDSVILPDTHWFAHHSINNARMNTSRGWEIYPESIYHLFQMVKNVYGNIPSFVSENGMGVEEQNAVRENGTIQDDYRIEFHKEHVYWVHKAIEDGVNVIGYHMWTYIDNWSWSNAYKNRYGFIELDLKTNNRIPKKSATWMKELGTTNILKADTKNY